MARFARSLALPGIGWKCALPLARGFPRGASPDSVAYGSKQFRIRSPQPGCRAAPVSATRAWSRESVTLQGQAAHRSVRSEHVGPTAGGGASATCLRRTPRT